MGRTIVDATDLRPSTRARSCLLLPTKVHAAPAVQGKDWLVLKDLLLPLDHTIFPIIPPRFTWLATRCGLAVLLHGTVALSPLAARAERQVHLDVNRYCRDTFRAGKVADGRQFVRDGRHIYRDGLHGCQVQFQLRQKGILPVERIEFWEVWANKACREQNRSPLALSRYDGPVIWCVLP